MKRLLTLLTAASLLGAAPLPSPSPLPSAAPAAKATPAARPTPAPPKDSEDNRVGITGVWEVALQEADGVVYTHFKIKQDGNTLAGLYLAANGKKFPLTGTFDGKKVRLIVSLPDGTALVFTGSTEGNTDMVGTMSTAKDLLGFTAAYRPKFKWIDNISPGQSGMGGMGNPGGNP